MQEVWKDIPMYAGIYEVSTFGRVRSKVTGLTTFGYLNNKGYLRVDIHLNGLYKRELVHRLVAITFIENPNNLPQVNHKDECRTNNRLENLEWCTAEYNNAYGSHKNNPTIKPSKTVMVDGIEFPSITKCAKYLNLPLSTINNYLIGRHKMPSELVQRGLSYAKR